MSGMTMKDVRAKFPQYNDMDDGQLADALHQRYYSDIPKDQFYGQIGYTAQAPAQPPVTSPAPEPLATPSGPSGLPSGLPPTRPQARPEPSSAIIPPRSMPQNPIPALNGPGPGGGMQQLFDQGILPQRYQEDLLASMAQPSVQVGEPAVDPFAGEGFGDLARRRGQQFASGATEVVASLPEAAAIANQIDIDNKNAEIPAFLQELQASRATLVQSMQSGMVPSVDGPRPATEDDTSRMQRTLDNLDAQIVEMGGVLDQVEPLAGRAAGETPNFAKGDEIRDASTETFGAPDPRDQSFWSQVAQGAGNMTAMALSSIAASAVSGPVGGLAVGGSQGAALNASSMYREAVQSGADEETARRASQFGAAIGASEIIPISRALKIVPESFRGKVSNLFYKRFAHIAQSSGEEAAQEYLATVANNIVSQQLYDPERGWTEGATEAALVGAVLGAGIGAAGSAFDSGSATETPAAPPAETVAPVNDPETLQPVQEAETVQPVQAEVTEPVQAAPIPVQGEGNFEIMDETETVNGESVPTGRQVRVNLDDGTVSPVEPSAPIDAQQDAVQGSQGNIDGSVVGTDPTDAPAAKPRQQRDRPPSKRPFTNAIKEEGVDPDGPLAEELRSSGITAQNTPGLFRRGGMTDGDNLVADEWGEYANLVGSDGSYLSKQGVIDALVSEFEGTPIQNADQVERQAVADARALAAEERKRRADALTPEVVQQVQQEEVSQGGVYIAPPGFDSFDNIGDRRVAVIDSLNRALDDMEMSSLIAKDDFDWAADALESDGGSVDDVVWESIRRSLKRADGQPDTRPIEDIPWPGVESRPVETGRGQGDGGASPSSIEQPAEQSATENGSAPISGDAAPSQSEQPSETVKTESTPEGDQSLIPGVEPVSTREKLEAEQAKPKRGGDAPAPAGRGDLFGDPADRADLFDAPKSETKPEKKPDTKPKKRPLIEGKEKEKLDNILAQMKDKMKNQLNSGIDPELVSLAVQAADIYVRAGVRRFNEFVQEMSTALELPISKIGRYARIAYNDVRDEMQSNGEAVDDMDDSNTVISELARLNSEEKDASGTSGSVERDSGDAEPSDELGGADVPVTTGTDGSGSSEGRGKPDGESRDSEGRSGVSDGDASSMGEDGNSSVSGNTRRDGQSADDRDRAGSGDNREQRLPDDPGTAEDTAKYASDRAELTDRVDIQAKADRVKVKPADPNNIDQSLPLLLPEQRDDVLKVEQRFSKPNSHGMLLTNGTGTGKTYSGGGVIKRFVQQGKDNILITAPSQGIIDAWVEMGADMGIPISKLEDTKAAGEGVVATTYANMAENRSLASREWDLVVTDESQKLSQNSTGDPTGALDTLRSITNRPEDLFGKAKMLLGDKWDKVDAMPKGEDKNAASRLAWEQTSALAAKIAGKERSKVLFLSATPFAYDKNVDYGAGYLFDYGADGVTESGSRQDGRNLFFVENFGYRIRYHKLTKPEAAVDKGVFEREFHEKLKSSGALSGRMLDIAADYDRKFVRIEDVQGQDIDRAMKIISDNSDNTAVGRKWRELGDHVRRNFTYLRRLQLLEAIKARAAVKDIQTHMEMGRKIVVFHDYNKGGGFNPFTGSDVVQPKAEAMQGYQLLLKEMPEVANLNFSDLQSPIETLTREFKDRAAVYNGTVSGKERKKAKDDFNRDGSGLDLIIVQSAAGEAGISLHDITGKHQRALINLGMPVRPTTTLQEEGRIRRVGSVTDAAFRYYTTGTAWERQAFAGKIAENSGTVENLALGNDARAIRDAFINAYEDADTYPPSPEDGKGGRDADRSVAKTSPYDQAKTHYFARTKNNRRRDQRQGIDFYSTPEPLGFKMAEWAGTRTYERFLEPSAGDGAISRYAPADADRTIIEPSIDLSSKAQLRTPGAKVIESTFEEHHPVNKYDTIVMNPPFGSGGKTAMDHVGKALRHLKPGGRVVALIPTGPAADKRFDAMLSGIRESHGPDIQISAIVKMPTVTFEKAGTSVASRVVIFDHFPGEKPENFWVQEEVINMTGASDIGQFFEKLEDISVPERPEVPQVVEDVVETTLEPAPVAGDKFDVFEFENTKTGAKMYGVQIKEKLGDAYKAVAEVAKGHGGYYSRYQNNAAGAKRGFLFTSDADRQAFMDDVQKPVEVREQREGLAFEAAMTDIMPDLRKRLDVLNLKRVSLSKDTVSGRRGAFTVDMLGNMEILIAPSLDADQTLDHEAIHALRSMNLFTPQEWKALEAKAAQEWVEKYDIPARYPDLLPVEQIEEAVAEAFAEARASGTPPKGGVLVNAFNKIARIFKAISSVLKGHGFATVDQVFDRVSSGEVGARDRRGSVEAQMKEARFPKRQTAQQRTSMNSNNGFAHIPDRRIWEELSAANAGYWGKLKAGSAAANDWVDKARIRFQDRFLPILRAQQAIIEQTGKDLPQDQNAYIAEETFSGKVGRHLFEIDEDFTKPIIDIMAGSKGEKTMDSEFVGTWLYARHAKERNKQIASINPNMQDGGSGMTNAEADAVLSTAAASPFAARLSKVEKLISDLRARTIDLREKSGLITVEEANLWRTQYKNYVPLKGFADTDHSETTLDITGIGRRFNTKGQESKRALGRKSEAFNPLQAAITQAQEVAIRAEKNIVGQSLYELAKNNPSPKMWTLKTPHTKRFYNRTTGLVESRVEDPVSLFMDPNEMALKIEGKEHRIMFHDERIARAAGSMGADQLGAVTKVMNGFGRYFSAINTMLNPVFTVVNGFRDMITAQISIGHFGGKDANRIRKAMLKSWPKAFVGAYRGQKNKADSEWTKHYRDFEKAGGKVAFWRIEQPEAGITNLKRRVNDIGAGPARRSLKYLRFSSAENPVLGFVERTNLAVDNAIRLAAFVEAKNAGWTDAQAASLSKNMTVNFNRRGEMGAGINAWYVFANAAVQGTHTLIRSMKTKQVRRILASVVVMSIIQDLINAAMSEEDDDGELAYDKIPTWKTQMNSAFMLAGGEEAITVPLPYGYNLFSYMGQQAGKIMRGVKDPSEAFADTAVTAFTAFSPVSGSTTYSMIMPTVLDPISEMAMNENWLGRPIRPESQYADYGPDAYKYYRGASLASRNISDVLNRTTGGTIAESGFIDVSPEYIDHSFAFATGGAGRFIGQTADLTTKVLKGEFDSIEARDIPFVSRLYADTGNWLDRNRYYEFRDKVKEANDAQKTYQAANLPVPEEVRRLAGMYRSVLDTDKILRNGRTQISAIRDRDDISASDKRDRVGMVETSLADVYLGFNRTYIDVMGPQGE